MSKTTFQGAVTNLLLITYEYRYKIVGGTLLDEYMEGLNLGNLPLGESDADWVRVMAAATNSSLRVKVAAIVSYFIEQRKEEYVSIIEYTARKYGLTFSECFHKLRKGEDLGEPLEYFDVDFEIENLIRQFQDEDKKTGKTG